MHSIGDLGSIFQRLLTKIIHSTYLGNKGLNFFLEIFDLIFFLKVDYSGDLNSELVWYSNG